MNKNIKSKYRINIAVKLVKYIKFLAQIKRILYSGHQILKSLNFHIDCLKIK